MERYYQKEIECAPYEEIRRIQSEKLVKQVKHVWDNVPYYRKKMEEKGVTPDDIKSVDDLHKLPFLSKKDLRDAYPTGLLGVPQKDCVRIHSTSGTTGKRVIAFYTQHDAAATAFDKGYNWQVSTTDKGVVIEVEFLESWEGMAAPYIFFLDSEGNLQGNDIAMQWIGTTARYVLKDKQNGDIVRFLVKIAYSGHVAFTERIEYEVGHNCEETPDAVDNLRQTTIDFTAPLEVFDLTGARVNQALDNLPQGVYIIRQGDVTKKIVRQ